VGLLAKVTAKLREGGPKALWAEAKPLVYDAGREAICLRVDLTNPKNLLRPRDLEDPVELLPFDAEVLPELLEVLRVHAPELTERVRKRYLEGMLGFVARHGGELIGYVFYTPGTDDPERIVHPDLTWLPVRPTADEVYAFDYYVREDARGRGALFVRAVQQEQAALGYTASYGYVYAHNRPALWLYRTTGWKEAARVTEARVLGKLALVDGRVFWMHPHSRSLLLPR